MPVTVIKSISTTHAKISGNVESISTTPTEVSSVSDLQSLETKLNKKINELDNKLTRLETLIDNLTTATAGIPGEIKKEVKAMAESQRIVLQNEYKALTDDMASKCAKISEVLKK